MSTICIGVLGYIFGTMAYGVRFGLCWAILCTIVECVRKKG